MRELIQIICAAAFTLAATLAQAGNQLEEKMSDSVRAALHKAVADQSVPFLAFASTTDARAWLDAMSHKLARRMPDRTLREEFLVTVHYEA
ncbi:MAG: lytic transglycosylase domain-containing protein, partial [Burkholderiales bacterium]